MLLGIISLSTGFRKSQLPHGLMTDEKEKTHDSH